MKSLVVFSLLFFVPFFCNSQIDSISSQKERISAEVVFGADRFFPSDNKQIYLPKNIQTLRSLNSPLGLNFDKYTDIPQFHASVFAGLLTKVKFANGYSLNFDIISEERGQSFGSLNLKNVLIYPRICGTIEDDFSLFKLPFSFVARIGDLIKYENNYGLTFNNIDVQGLNIKLNQKNWWFSYSLIGDISQHIGLNINDVYSFKIGYNKRKNNGYEIELGGSLDQLRILNIKSIPLKNVFSFFGSVKKNRIKFFAELGYRIQPSRDTLNFYSPAGGLLGFEFMRSSKKINWNLKFKARYYGISFNDDFINYAVRYRSLSKPTLNGNFVGDYLYPLINTYRDFDQWSVYTEYQSDQIISASFRLKAERKLYQNLFYKIDFEGNLIASKRHSSALYTFYSTGFKYKMPGAIFFELYISNKVMNLDVQYQTFYQTQQPIFGFSIKRLGSIDK